MKLPSWSYVRNRLGETGGSVVTVVLGTSVGQAVTLILTPVLTRLYSPDSFGVFSYILGIVMVVSVVSAGRFEVVIPMARSDEDARAATWISIAVLLVTTTATSLGVALAGNGVDGLTELSLMPWLWFLVPLVLLTGLFLILSQVLIRERDFASVARRNVIQGSGTALSQLVAALWTTTPAGLLIGQASGRLISCTGMFKVVRALSSGSWLAIIDRVRPVLRRYRRVPIFFVPSSLLNTLGGQLPLLLVGIWFGAAASGNLAIAIRLIGIPGALIGYALSQVLLGTFAEDSRTSSGSAQDQIRRVLRVTVPIGVALGVFAITLGPILVPPLLGPGWAQSGSFVAALGVSAGLAFVVSPLQQLMVVHEQYVSNLILDLSRVALVLAGGYLAFAATDSAGIVVFVMAACQGVNYVLTFILVWRTAIRVDAANRDRTAGAQNGPECSTNP